MIESAAECAEANEALGNVHADAGWAATTANSRQNEMNFPEGCVYLFEDHPAVIPCAPSPSGAPNPPGCGVPYTGRLRQGLNYLTHDRGFANGVHVYALQNLYSICKYKSANDLPAAHCCAKGHAFSYVNNCQGGDRCGLSGYQQPTAGVANPWGISVAAGGVNQAGNQNECPYQSSDGSTPPFCVDSLDPDYPGRVLDVGIKPRIMLYTPGPPETTISKAYDGYYCAAQGSLAISSLVELLCLLMSQSALVNS